MRLVVWLVVMSSLLLSGAAALADGGTTLYLPAVYPLPQNKLGVAGGTVAQAQALGGAWLYDWTTQPPMSDAPVESVPMIGHAGAVGQVLGGNSPWVLGFNEPDLSSQANLTPQQAAVLWRQIETLYPRRLLVSPAVSCGDLYWLVRFRLAYQAEFGGWPRFDALAMHCYRWTAAGCAQVLDQYVAWAHDWSAPGQPLPIWVTEFAFVPAWATDAEAEARAFVALLERTPEVRRYSPFVSYTPGGTWYWPDVRAAANPSLFVGPGSTQLTPLGAWYGR